MATKIRLKRIGKIRNAQYRVIVIDSRAKRDGQAIEEIGIYQPKAEPSIIKVNSERALYWLGVGAQPTESVTAILKLTGDWQKHTGDTSIPSGVKPQPEKKDKAAIFNAALAEADDAPRTEAITRKAKKADEAEAEAEAPEAEEKAEEA
ncbi:MAG: 30S ribosomal protein S16 [Propionibacteriaceae bacterium]